MGFDPVLHLKHVTHHCIQQRVEKTFPILLALIPLAYQRRKDRQEFCRACPSLYLRSGPRVGLGSSCISCLESTSSICRFEWQQIWCFCGPLISFELGACPNYLIRNLEIQIFGTTAYFKNTLSAHINIHERLRLYPQPWCREQCRNVRWRCSLIRQFYRFHRVQAHR